MRISHFLARAGIASRRKAEEYVSAGLVTVNGTVCRELFTQVEPGRDAVQYAGKPVALAATHLTLALNKPPGVMVTREDPEGRPTVYDLLAKRFGARLGELVYAGRLDYMTAGLLILSTDGALIQRLTHPKHESEKTYVATVARELGKRELQELRSGVTLDGGEQTRSCEVDQISKAPPIYRIRLREGKNRQIRRMFEAVDSRVEELSRVQVGALKLEDLGLKPGEARELTEEEMELL